MKIESLLFASALLCTSAFGASTTNFNDQWGNPNEIGWGISLLQQGKTIFIDLFAYDANNQPTWFVAGASLQVPSPAGHLVFCRKHAQGRRAVLRHKSL